MENKFYYQPYYVSNYLTFNDHCPYKEDRVNNVISTKGGHVLVQPMWRMELLGKFYGVNILEYQDNTNHELYDEMLWSCNSKEEREECYDIYYDPDKFDDYFECLAEVAAEVGSGRAEIKCLVKSLILKYSRISNVSDFPHCAFNKLYDRLVLSKDVEQLRVAERLSRYHVKMFEGFLRDKLMDAQ